MNVVELLAHLRSADIGVCDEAADVIERYGSALLFYADPDTYFAVGFWFDPPCGGFEDDFDEGHEEYDRPMPGKRAREALFSEERQAGDVQDVRSEPDSGARTGLDQDTIG